ncbi:MAG: 23S rRNA (adenine(2503)-C(2))-methyltransferase RlmN [Acidimicrobiia bacterium]|nr:23S rRNA (adenine(2503)-C(2))-methyltransferase RlmN [Acidimicrobiia bacterium]
MLYLTAPEQLDELLPNEPPYRADQVRQWLYEQPTLDIDGWTNLPKSLRDGLRNQLWPFKVELEQRADKGNTVKWLFRTPDGISIESVLMAYPDRVTLCVSSQAGCAMACTFCATGQFGFDRHLEPGEIIAQVAYAKAIAASGEFADGPRRLNNVVFMGMGEPLANYARVRESLRLMIDVMDMSARNITVSTVGVVPGMRRLAEEPWQVGLAVSLHAADDELRSRLVPLNDRYPLAEVEQAAAQYFEAKGRRVSIEWTMMDGVNDDDEQAKKLAAMANRLHAHVNLIALNPTPLSNDKPSRQRTIKRFAQVLEAEGANVTVRDTRGQDIDAACGQLRVRANA